MEKLENIAKDIETDLSILENGATKKKAKPQGVYSPVSRLYSPASVISKSKAGKGFPLEQIKKKISHRDLVQRIETSYSDCGTIYKEICRDYQKLSGTNIC